MKKFVQILIILLLVTLVASIGLHINTGASAETKCPTNQTVSLGDAIAAGDVGFALAPVTESIGDSTWGYSFTPPSVANAQIAQSKKKIKPVYGYVTKKQIVMAADDGSNWLIPKGTLVRKTGANRKVGKKKQKQVEIQANIDWENTGLNPDFSNAKTGWVVKKNLKLKKVILNKGVALKGLENPDVTEFYTKPKTAAKKLKPAPTPAPTKAPKKTKVSGGQVGTSTATIGFVAREK